MCYTHGSLPSSEKLPPGADGNQYSGAQLDIIQRMSDLKALSPQWGVYIKSLLREPCEEEAERGQEPGDERLQESKAF